MMSGTPRQPPDDRIAITGMGVLSPIGQGIEAFSVGPINGVSGITTIEAFSDPRLACAPWWRGQAVTRYARARTALCQRSRASQFLIYAATEATSHGTLCRKQWRQVGVWRW